MFMFQTKVLRGLKSSINFVWIDTHHNSRELVSQCSTILQNTLPSNVESEEIFKRSIHFEIKLKLDSMLNFPIIFRFDTSQLLKVII